MCHLRAAVDHIQYVIKYYLGASSEASKTQQQTWYFDIITSTHTVDIL